MNVIKLFRKHTKILLIVFMSLLLIAFLLPQQMFSGQGRSSQDPQIGSAYGEPIHRTDLGAAQRVWRIAAQLRLIDLYRSVGILVPADLNEGDVYLLMAEAKNAGVRFGRDYAKNKLTQEWQVPPQALEAVRDANKTSYDAIYDAVAEWMGIMYVCQCQMEAMGMSWPEPRLEIAYRDQYQDAELLCSTLRADTLLDQVREPTEEELQALFDACKDRVTAHTEDELVFGYLEPARVQIEYLTVDPKQIQDLVRVRDSEARSHFEKNQQQYVEKRLKPQPEGSEAPPEYEDIQLTFEEAKARVKDDLRAAKAILDAQRLVNDIRQEANSVWLGSAIGEDGFRTPPPADQIVSFEELRDRFSATYPVIYSKTEWVDEAGLRSLPLLNDARFRAGQSNFVQLAQLAFRARGLIERTPEDRMPVLSVNEPSPVMFRGRFDQRTRQFLPEQSIVFRVVGVKPSGPPASLDVVREQVIKDWKLSEAYRLAGKRANALAESARRVGLREAVAAAADLRTLLGETPTDPATTQPTELDPVAKMNIDNLGPNAPVRFTRLSQAVRGIGYAPSLAKQVFALGDPETLGQAERILAAGLTRSQAWVVVEFTGLKPLYAGEFEKQRQNLSRGFQMDAYRAMMEWFSSENIQLRAGWQLYEGDR